MHPSEEKFDVIVIGGGPGGSSAATLVAMQGHRVLLLERETFPRHQIGESLLPVTVHGICKMLGVEEEIKNAGFMRKGGGSFRWGKNPEPWTFSFETTPMLSGTGFGYAYQVERDKFDHILLENARRKGADAREGCEVLEPLREGERVVGVRYRGPDGAERVARARFVIDASGHQSKLQGLAGERVYSKFFQNVALYGYYEGGKRLPPPNQGNILCAAFEHGWFWYIPLTDGLTSVGAVVDKAAHADKLKAGHAEAMARFIDACPLIKEYLAGAQRVTEGRYGRFRVRKDYSYCNTRFWAPGLMLVGDAGCFIDPVFSSGVHLTTYAALLAARSVNTCLAGGLDEARCMDEFERRYRREYIAFYDFLVGFYDTHHDEGSYFWQARKVLHTEERDSDAFVRLVAGGATAASDFLHMSGVKRGFFEDYITSRSINEDPEQFFRRYSDKQFDARAFTRNLRRERAAILEQASAGEARESQPLFEGGLVPSRDGFHWLAAP